MVLLLLCGGCSMADIDLSKPQEVIKILQYSNNICDYEIYDGNGMGTDILRANCGIAKPGDFIMSCNNTIVTTSKPDDWRK